MHRTLPLVAIFAAILGMMLVPTSIAAAQEADAANEETTTTTDDATTTDDGTADEGGEMAEEDDASTTEEGDMEESDAEGDDSMDNAGEGEGDGSMTSGTDAAPMPEPAPEAAEEDEADSTFRVHWNNRVQMDAVTPAGKVRFRIGGRFHLHAVGGAAESQGAGAGPQFEPVDGVFFRRARIYFRGQLFDKAMNYMVQVDFSSGAVVFADVFMQLNNIGPGSLRFGQYKHFFGFEEQTSSNDIPFLERGFVSMFFQGRQTGFSYHANVGKELFNFAIGVFAGQGPQGQTTSTHDYLISSRFWVSLFNDDDAMNLHFALSLNQAIFNGDGNIRTRSRGIVRTLEGARIIDRNFTELDGFTLIGFEAGFFTGPLRAAFEFAGASTAPTDGATDPDGRFPWALQVIVGYVLTGEDSEYDSGSGDMASPKPDTLFGVDGGTGAFEVVARFDVANLADGLDGAAADGFTATQFALGVNWYLNRNARVMATFGYAAVAESANYLFFGMRFQLAI